jgi:hypothetical protein
MQVQLGKVGSGRGRKPVKSLLALPDGFVGIVLLTKQSQHELRGERKVLTPRDTAQV